MDICRGGKGVRAHDEVCYDGAFCPICSIDEELRGEIANLKEEISSMEKQIAELERGE